MPIIEDFLVSLAAGFTQTLLQHVVGHWLDAPQKQALESCYQSGFESMLRTVGSGLGQAELGQVSELFQVFLGQSDVADAFLEMALKNLEPNVELLVSSFYKLNNTDSLENISFDLSRGLQAFKESLGRCLIAAAKQKGSPLFNLVSVSMLEEALRRTQYNSELRPMDNLVAPSLSQVGLANIDLRRSVTEVSICRSSPNVLYALIGGTLFVSRDGKRTWNSTSRSAGLIAADPINPNIVYALRTTGIYVSKDFGESWTRRSDAVVHRWFTGGQLTVHPGDYRKIYLADGLGVHVSEDQGCTWRNCIPERRVVGPTRWYYAIDMNRLGTLVAVYDNGALYVTDDWGQTWDEIDGPPTGDRPHPGLLQPLFIDPETSSVWYADLGTWKTSQRMGSPRGVFVTYDRGVNWELVTTVDGRTDWTIDYIEIVQHSGKSIVYAATPTDTTFFSWDKGKSWNQMTIDGNGLPDGVDKDAFWALAPGDAFTSDGLLYLKTRQGLLSSTDNGRTWFY